WSVSVVRGPVTLTLATLGKGATVYVDAVQFEPGAEATPFAPHPRDGATPQAGNLTPPSVGPALINAARTRTASLLSGIAPVPDEVTHQTAAMARRLPLHVSIPADGPKGESVPVSGGIPLPRG